MIPKPANTIFPPPFFIVIRYQWYSSTCTVFFLNADGWWTPSALHAARWRSRSGARKALARSYVTEGVTASLSQIRGEPFFFTGDLP